MKKATSTIIGTVVVVAILVSAYFIFLYRSVHAVADGLEELDNLTIRRVAGELPLDVRDPLWQRFDPETIHLYPQSARAPYGNSEKDLLVRAVYNGTHIAFLLEFEDQSVDLGAPVDPDACAVLITDQNAPASVQMMGYGGLANVWQWLADRNLARYEQGNESVQPVRELIASGPGTQTELARQTVEGRGEFRDGRWAVVFKRKLASSQEGEIELRPGTEMRTAFAVWNGSKMESFSRKSIAIIRVLSWEN